MIYIVIAVFNRWNFTKPCLESLQNQTDQNFKVVVVDHGSTDSTSEYITEYFPKTILLKGDKSMWWTAATNLGVKYALENGADFILTLNNDLEVAPDYISKLLIASKANSNSIIGSVAVDIDNKNSIVYAGIKWNSWFAKYHAVEINGLPYKKFSEKYEIIETDLLPGRGTLIPTEVFRSIGLFNEKNFPHYMADEDLSLRARKIGFKCFVSTSAVVYSHYQETGLVTNTKKAPRGIKFFKESLTSIKSPNNIAVRWSWARLNGSIPLLYFSIDFSRVLASLIIKSFR